MEWKGQVSFGVNSTQKIYDFQGDATKLSSCEKHL